MPLRLAADYPDDSGTQPTLETAAPLPVAPPPVTSQDMAPRETTAATPAAPRAGEMTTSDKFATVLAGIGDAAFGLAGIKGQAVALISGLRKERLDQQDRDLRALTVGTEAIKNGVDLADRLPGDKREQFVKDYGDRLRKIEGIGPNIADAWEQFKDGGDASKTIGLLADFSPATKAILLNMAGGNQKKVLEIVKDKDTMARLQQLEDNTNRPEIITKVGVFGKLSEQNAPGAFAALKAAQADGTLTMAEVEGVNARLPKELALAPHEIASLRRDDGLQAQLGITSGMGAEKAAEASATAGAQQPFQKEMEAFKKGLEVQAAGPKAKAEAEAKLGSEKELSVFRAGLEIEKAGPIAKAQADGKVDSEKTLIAFRSGMELQNAGPKAKAEAEARLGSEKEIAAFRSGLQVDAAGKTQMQQAVDRTTGRTVFVTQAELTKSPDRYTPTGSPDEKVGIFAQEQKIRADQEIRVKEAEAKLSQPGKTFTQANTLRDELRASSKDFITVQDAYQKVEETAKSKSGAGDMAMLYGFIKLLDQQTGVREGEYATAAQAGSVPQRVIGAYNKAVTGEKMPDDLRQDFIDQARKIYAVHSQGQDRVVAEYERIATKNKIDPADVIVDFKRPAPEAMTAADLKKATNATLLDIAANPDALSPAAAAKISAELKRRKGGQ